MPAPPMMAMPRAPDLGKFSLTKPSMVGQKKQTPKAKIVVKIQGFMMPLDMGEKQARFILSALPPSCSFCLPGGPEQMVEVQAKTPVKYGFEPILLTGKLAVLKDDPMGLYYRLTDAVVTVGK